MKAKKVYEILKEGTLRFSDGVDFDTSGELRAEKRHDGWYIVGEGKLFPMDSEEEAYQFLKDNKSKSSLSN